jgi:hypothetical protein
MEQTIPEITKRYLTERTLEVFAAGLGIEAAKQNVSQWANGKHLPSWDTLLSVIASPTAEGWAKAWAGECSAVLMRQTAGC